MFVMEVVYLFCRYHWRNYAYWLLCGCCCQWPGLLSSIV